MTRKLRSSGERLKECSNLTNLSVSTVKFVHYKTMYMYFDKHQLAVHHSKILVIVERSHITQDWINLG